MPEWTNRPCRGGKTEWFFIEPDEAGYAATIAELREDYCGRCPLRRECFERVMVQEDGKADAYRFGFEAGLTAGQRVALARRGIWRCPTCDAVFDPLAFATGELHCDGCGQTWSVRPLPHDGLNWFDRQTALGEKVVAWLISETEPGQEVPFPTGLARLLKERKEDMVQVFEALVLDGTLQRLDGPKRYVRVGQTVAMRRWHRFHLAARATAA
jgi:hypothetical protein